MNERVVAFARRLADRLPPTSLTHVIDLAEHHETVIALEDLVSHLDDGDIAVTVEERAVAEQLVSDLHLAPMTIDVLRSLRRPDDRSRTVHVFTVAHARDPRALEALRVVAQPRGEDPPPALRIWDWDRFADQLPAEAGRFVAELLSVRGRAVTLLSSTGQPIDAIAERDRLAPA